MKLGTKGTALIKSFETLELKAYRCSAGVLTIGYGHTKNVKEGQVITETEANRLFAEDVAQFENAVNNENLKLTQNQFDALVSFSFNVGAGAFRRSTLLRKAKVNVNDSTIRAEFAQWNKVKGKITSGLTRRRTAEANLYFS